MQGEQLMLCSDGQVRTKAENAIKRLQSFEPPEGYFVAFSGGKDSQCIYHLCQMAGVKFDAHYSVTSVDPPELVQFIKRQYPDVIFDLPRYANGERITMWNLIQKHSMPPTRMVRYCCEELKESRGEGRVVVTGVRWAESARRKASYDVASIKGKPKATGKMAQELGADYRINKSGALVLNDDNDPARRMVEHCYRTQKVMVNPIVDWETEDVWTFLDEIAKVPHCCLYDQGFKRLGCIGCPMSVNAAADMERWPKYKELYLRAFTRMIKAREETGTDNLHPCDWSTPEKVMAWWLQDQKKEE
nr:MAG TPA: phosphoadenosine-phosphosulfate reductase [Caudoviricetes sp.]